MASNGFLGSNPQDMQDLISKLDQAIQKIEEASNLVNNKVQNVQWNGNDADRFRNSEWPNSKNQLKKVVTDLEQVKQTVKKQKAEQEKTSAH